MLRCGCIGDWNVCLDPVPSIFFWLWPVHVFMVLALIVFMVFAPMLFDIMSCSFYVLIYWPCFYYGLLAPLI